MEGEAVAEGGGGEEMLSCGLVMPISAIDGCPAEHWIDVKNIIVDAVNSIQGLKFQTRLVSDADDVGVIQRRIVQGIYSSDVVVCDVSGKNSNVMFELGMRLAFDKPTVIIKDDKTEYSFDTSLIEHLTYPRDLRFHRMLDFKQNLASKIVATYTAAKTDPEHSTFLKNFGTFKVAQLQEKEISAGQAIIDAISDLQKDMHMLRQATMMENPRRYLSGRMQSLEEVEQEIRWAENVVRGGGSEADRKNLDKRLKPIVDLRDMLPAEHFARVERLLAARNDVSPKDAYPFPTKK
jgi:nucleoside 2-deoxyribosyltransferase